MLGELGLDISSKKLVPPATAVTCLGILMDHPRKTISIPSEKLAEIVQLCADWDSKTYCSKRDLQSLLGSLLYVSKCVKHSRFFLNRMLQLLRNNVDTRKILLTAEFKSDLAWFNCFFLTTIGLLIMINHIVIQKYIWMLALLVWGRLWHYGVCLTYS